MVQSNGGGCGIIDFDHDSWPDILMTQGGEWPVNSEATKPPVSDQLFRNLRGQRLTSVTPLAGAGDTDFSQGIAIGDIDADGFPDVFIANVGQNRLLRNNGDGTFSDATSGADIRGKEWSTSCVFADLNADGLDDLYVVNYLSLEDAAADICHENGKLKRCASGDFAAADDQLLLNSGDGTFQDVSQTSGIIHSDGRGLGLVAADFDGNGSIDLFVANDAVPNFMLLNQGTSDGTETPQFIEHAFAAGVAVSEFGAPQACMGVAVSDFDHNRIPDVFVTNFLHETNTMYLGMAPGLFVDRTNSLQLTQPSLSMLGFGTQPIDLDLDGFDDLAVANGHIDDMSADGVAYRMPMQFFRNRQGNSFLPVELTGEFLTSGHVGRSLATMDWNRDGKQDLVVGLLDEASCLLENATRTDCHWLQIQLVGEQAARPASGATVTVTGIGDNADQFLRMKIVGGGGFQAANESLLSFGLGTDRGPFVVSVAWPDGSRQKISEVPAGSAVALSQHGGRLRFWRIPE
ncbi:MAG: CRTAC1 family protein [Planctomycetaceae bacterium]